jgi:hypothetical protein
MRVATREAGIFNVLQVKRSEGLWNEVLAASLTVVASGNGERCGMQRFFAARHI